jgi:predicted GH43/DUF377 family glycosyl hydrolase
MFKWEKLGRVFDPTKVEGRSWLREFAQAPATLIFNEFVRVYFSCRPKADANGQYVSYSAYVDLNRKDLLDVLRVAEQPILELGELGTFDEFGTYPVTVIEKDGKLLLYYGGWTRCESIPFTVSIGAAVSHDEGVTFEKLGKGPILTWNFHDPYVLSGPKIRRFGDTYYLWYVAGTKWLETGSRPDAVYKIRVATSEDGMNWRRDGRNIIDNRIEENECQASPDVFFYQGRYHMFFCYKYSLDFRNNDRGYRIGYAVSDDLESWTRNDEMAGIDISQSGWDDQSIAYPHVFELDGQVYMLYLGNQVGRYGFGAARLLDYQP